MAVYLKFFFGNTSDSLHMIGHIAPDFDMVYMSSRDYHRTMRALLQLH